MNKINISGFDEFKISKDEVKQITNEVLSIFGLEKVELNINFVSPLEIKKLNFSHRGIDKPTDVLSFPQIEIKGAKTRLLGDLIISPEITRKKEETITEVIKHGMLHLLGFDHEADAETWDQAARKINCLL